MLGLTATEVRSSPWPILRRWLAERLPRRRRAPADVLSLAVRPSRTGAPSEAQAPLLDPIDLRQSIYGPGCVIPGDAPYLKELMSPLGLKPEMSLLDLNAGMGGAGMLITQAWKSYVAGFDRNPDLVQAGVSFLCTQKAGRRIQLAPYDPENFALRPGFYDCVMAREAISTLVDKEAFFQAVSLGLKSFGQVVITDFVRGDAPASDPGFVGWAAMQEQKPLLWSGEEYVAVLERLGCNVLIATDSTARYRSLLLRSWRRFLDHPELPQLRGRRALPLLSEVERCIRALAAFESGALRYFYICAQSTRSTMPLR
jgi:ubiquinone/menaquinone biosynthesis C-methylase UbiE